MCSSDLNPSLPPPPDIRDHMPAMVPGHAHTHPSAADPGRSGTPPPPSPRALLLRVRCAASPPGPAPRPPPHLLLLEPAQHAPLGRRHCLEHLQVLHALQVEQRGGGLLLLLLLRAAAVLLHRAGRFLEGLVAVPMAEAVAVQACAGALAGGQQAAGTCKERAHTSLVTVAKQRPTNHWLQGRGREEHSTHHLLPRAKYVQEHTHQPHAYR